MKKKNKKEYPLSSKWGFGLLISLTIISLLLSLRYGSADMTLKQFLLALIGRPLNETDSVILYMVRLPRVLAALLAGIGLSVSGVLLQTVTDNALAGPNIIGVNAGAGFAVVIALSLFPTLFWLMPLCAFFGALGTTLIIVILSGKGVRSKATIILSGVAVTALLNALISAFTLIDADILASFNSFSVGGFSGITKERLILPAIIIFISLAVSIIIAPRLNLLCIGDAYATSLGISVKTVRIVGIVCASASAAAVVSFAGLLGFVGLIVPHISRRLVGTKTRPLIFSSSLIGAIVTVLADLLGRVLAAPSEIPVGIMMAFIGAPFFIHLLVRSREV
jgi:iron complex transport system permease protein